MTDLFADLQERPESAATRTGVWWRRGIVTLFCLVALLALLNRFGQRPVDSAAAAPAATLSLSAPQAVRGGLFFQSRIEVDALHDVEHPRLVLDRGWFEGLQVNSINPDPAGMEPRDGKVVMSYDALKAGDRLTVWMQFEVNPTTIGRHDFGLELDDAEQPLTALHRNITILP